MKIWLSPYQLNKKMGGSQSGYLLKLEEESCVGYADIFPWPLFGDSSLEQIPNEIKSGRYSTLVKKSLSLARLDAKARSLGKPLAKKIGFLNHGLVLGEPSSWSQQIENFLKQDFAKIKIKLGINPKEEIRALHKIKEMGGAKKWLRLDFNGRGDLEFIGALSAILPQVEFVEDPFSDPSLWVKKDWPRAFDQPGFSADVVDYEFRIIKLAKCNIPEAEKVPLVFTSYLDHPLGIAHAMLQASSLSEQQIEYGFLSMNIYEENAFYDYFVRQGPRLEYQPDCGIGFTALLESQSWELIYE